LYIDNEVTVELGPYEEGLLVFGSEAGIEGVDSGIPPINLVRVLFPVAFRWLLW
jgi:hypothetical protein